MTTRKAFTLIELLVVVSIIALLIAILLPALGKARDTAKDAACLSNQRQNAIALFAYATDRRGKMPRSNAQLNANAGVYAVWLSSYPMDRVDERYVGHGLLMYHGQLEDPRSFYCPRSTDPFIKYDGTSASGLDRAWPSNGRLPHESGALPAGQPSVQTHYHYRSYLDKNTSQWRAIDLGRDPSLSDTAMMADNFTEPKRGVEIHHQDGYNVAYADGHGAFVREDGYEIRDYNGGSAYHAGSTGYQLQNEVWRDLLSESNN